MINIKGLIKALKAEDMVIFERREEDVLIGSAYFVAAIQIDRLAEVLIKAGYPVAPHDERSAKLDRRFNQTWQASGYRLNRLWTNDPTATPLVHTGLLFEATDAKSRKPYPVRILHDNQQYIGVQQRHLDIFGDYDLLYASTKGLVVNQGDEPIGVVASHAIPDAIMVNLHPLEQSKEREAQDECL